MVYQPAGKQGASANAAIVGVFGFLWFLAALINTRTVIVGGGPYFASTNPIGASFS